MNKYASAAASLRDRTKNLSDRDFLSAVLAELDGRIVFASSLGVEDQALTHLIASTGALPPIVTLDTGRLPQETYDLIDETHRRLGATIEVLFPDAAAVQTMVHEKGVNLFYESVENRKACCHVRKVEPLRKRLASFDAWITGLRRGQSPTRARLERVEYDAANQMIKINPLIDWTSDEVWSYLRANEIPYNTLHDRGYPSIGCFPCTRAVVPGEDERAGRWWWERPEQKECGIHIQDGNVVHTRMSGGIGA